MSTMSDTRVTPMNSTERSTEDNHSLHLHLSGISHPTGNHLYHRCLFLSFLAINIFFLSIFVFSGAVSGKDLNAPNETLSTEDDNIVEEDNSSQTVTEEQQDNIVMPVEDELDEQDNIEEPVREATDVLKSVEDEMDEEELDKDNGIRELSSKGAKPKKFKCELCTKECSNKYLLENHMKARHGEKPTHLKCKYCNKAFPTVGQKN